MNNDSKRTTRSETREILNDAYLGYLQEQFEYITGERIPQNIVNAMKSAACEEYTQNWTTRDAQQLKTEGVESFDPVHRGMEECLSRYCETQGIDVQRIIARASNRYEDPEGFERDYRSSPSDYGYNSENNSINAGNRTPIMGHNHREWYVLNTLGLANEDSSNSNISVSQQYSCPPDFRKREEERSISSEKSARSL